MQRKAKALQRLSISIHRLIALEYFKVNHHSNVLDSYKENKRLGTLVTNQRKAYKNNRLSQDKIKLLEKLNFIWSFK